MKTTKNRFIAFLPRTIMLLFGAFFIVILGILTFGDGAFKAYYPNKSLLGNIALFPIALLLAGGWIFFLVKGKGRSTNRRDLWVLAIYQVVLLGVQLFIARAIWFYPGWDVLAVNAAAQELVSGIMPSAEYFNLCPNNAPITFLLSIPLKIATLLGLAVPYAVLPYLSTLVHNLSLLLIFLSMRKLTQNRRLYWSFVAVLTAWIGIHIFMTVPYTDVYSLFFASLTFYLYLSNWRAFPKWFLLTFSCFFGASLKPSLGILFIAILMIKGIDLIGHRRDKAVWKHILIVLIAIVLGFIPAKLWQDQTTAYLAGTALPEGQLSTTHYLMLGMNGKTMGGHSPEDVAFTSSFGTLKESQAANLAESWSRFRSRSAAQNLRFFSIKAYKAYDDGTFGANMSLLMQEIPKRTDSISAFLRSIFYTDKPLNGLYSTVQQTLWLMILLLGVGCAWGSQKFHPALPLIALTLLGLSLYQLLFEVWPRYLFLFAPLYAIMAAMGADRLSQQIIKRSSKS